MLDYSKEVKNNDDFIVTRQHLEQWEAENGRIEEGTFVYVQIGQNVGQILNNSKIEMLMVTNIYQVGTRCFKILN